MEDLTRIEGLMACIRARRSVRTYDGSSLTPEQQSLLRGWAKQPENPWNVPLTIRLLSADEHTLRSMVVSGARYYLAAKGSRGPHLELAVGCSLERLVLLAQSLGLGTVWLGGTLDRSAFARAMELGEGELMPCVTPVGVPAKKMSLRESAMRMGTRAERRRPFEELFFLEGFDRPLSRTDAGRLELPLEAVRLAPSAVNRQPWRAVIRGNTVYFYLSRSKGMIGEKTGDLQQVDLGIALCHFDLAARALGLQPVFSDADPGLPAPPDTVFIGAYRLGGQRA